MGGKPDTVGWFDHFNGVVYLQRADAEAARAGGNTVSEVYGIQGLPDPETVATAQKYLQCRASGIYVGREQLFSVITALVEGKPHGHE